jgi:demethylmenaquinone methyltransferase/2-methoxy-6-polyprenyl-1,4-benzoquinol methylase
MSETKNTFTKKALKSPEVVESMFDAVADRYDLANRLLSLGRDQKWRTMAAKATGAGRDSIVMDACTGTADLALAVHVTTGSKVVGVDFSKDMLRIGKEKIEKAGLAEAISFKQASVMELPYEDNAFDAVTIGFGLRNTPDYQGAIKEFYRVVKPGGRFVCLESSQPESSLLKIPYTIYLTTMVPLIGRVASTDYKAYKYLSDSTQAFPPKKELADMMTKAGWKDVKIKSLLFGSVAIHSGVK